MSKIKGAIIVDTDRCKGCNLCAVACPFHILTLTTKKVNHKGYPYIEITDPETCTGCCSCAIVCPDGCITVYRKKKD